MFVFCVLGSFCLFFVLGYMEIILSFAGQVLYKVRNTISEVDLEGGLLVPEKTHKCVGRQGPCRGVSSSPPPPLPAFL